MAGIENKISRSLSLFLAVSFACFLLPAAAGAAGTPILGTYSNWRIFSIIKPPVIQDGTEIEPVKVKIRWLDSDSAPAPADWNKAEIDDSGWLRGPVTVSPETAMLERLYLRGKFTVTSPGSVGTLTLTAEYHGGIIVYLNGEEVGRANVGKDVKDGQKEPVLAEKYPPEAFVTEKGMYLGPEGAYLEGRPNGAPLSPESKKRMELWVRRANIKIPAKALKKGINVLGIEVIRAGFDNTFNKVKMTKRVNSFPHEFMWATCEMLKLELTAAGSSGLIPNTARPQSFQVWNADIMAGDTDLDFGSQAEPLRPVKITGPRNGIFSGKLNTGSTKPIQGLTVKAGGLKGPVDIPAAAVKIRYGVPWGSESNRDATYYQPRPVYTAAGTLLASLSNNPPKEYTLGKANGSSLAGAVAPVWITVNIPKDAPAGLYTGVVTIKTSGAKDIAAAVELKVLPYTLPDRQDYSTWVDLIQSPDTLALEYKLPLWSEKHMAMIAESFSLLGGTGARIVYIPALAHTNLGNEESMIRWIKKGKNKYDWDFSIMDKYLDLAQKNMGDPKIVVLQVWEVYMRATMQKRFEDFVSLGYPQVTFVDPVSKRTEFGKLPPLSDPGSKAVWRELIEQVQARLKKRGLDKALMLGMFCDAIPPKEDVQFFLDAAPKLSWVQQGHGLFTKLQDIAEVGYNATVWGGFRFADGCKQTNQKGTAVVESWRGWNNKRLDAVFERNVGLDTYPASRWYFFPETGVTSELRGIGRIGGDYWKAVKDKNDRRSSYVHDRYKEGCWGGTSIALNLCNPVLAPGKDGPEATNRLIALMEGVEACEARIYIEKALLESKAKLGAELTGRCESALDERLLNMWRTLSNLQLNGPGYANAAGWRWSPGVSGHRYFLGSGWQKQAEDLFLLAGEIQQKLEKK